MDKSQQEIEQQIATLKELEVANHIERAELEKMKEDIDKDRQHLYSQQEAFKLAVREAKTRWQM